MLRTKTIAGTLLTSIAAAISVYLSFGPTTRLYQVLNALGVAALIAAPVIFWRREKRRLSRIDPAEAADPTAPAYEGPSDTSAAVTLGVAAFFLSLLLISTSRWPAVIAFGLAYSLAALLVSPQRPVRSLFVALATMICLWPIDPGFTSRIESRMTTYLASLASDRLDTHSILNVPEGRTLRTLGGEVAFGTPEGHVPSLRFGAVIGAALAVLLKRNMLHVLLMSISGWFWSVVLTGFYYYGLSARQNSGGLLEGMWGQIWFVLAVGLVLMLSTDQLWLVLGIFNPLSWFSRDRKRSSKKSNLGDSMSDASSQAAEEDDEPEPVKLPGVVFVALGLAALSISLLDVGRTLQHRRINGALDAKWRSAASGSDRSFFPERVGRWVKTDRKPLMNTAVPSRDSVGVGTYYLAGENFARVTHLGTFNSWYDRFLDFQSAGWRLGLQRIVNDPNRGLSYVLNEFSMPTGEHCTLIYQMKAIDNREDSLMEASIRSYSQLLLWDFFQGMFFRKSWKKEYYITEVASESYGPLSPNESQLLDELVRAAFESTLPSKLQPSD